MFAVSRDEGGAAARLVSAERFLGKVVAGASVRSGPAPSTHPSIAADTALALEAVEFAEFAKKRAPLPYFGERGPAYVTGLDRHVAASIDLA